MRQRGGQRSRAALALITLCLACDDTKPNDADMVDADHATYEAARMEHPVPPTPSSPGDSLSTAPREPEDETIRRRRAKGWAKKCVGQHPCPALRPLPKCKANVVETPFANSPAELLPGQVTLRGALFLGTWVTTAMACRELPLKECCNAVGGPAMLLTAETPVRLELLGCGGDDSGTCCNVPAFGQEVRVSGLLTYGELDETLVIQKPQLCVDQ